jgi:hypothetical protein
MTTAVNCLYTLSMINPSPKLWASFLEKGKFRSPFAYLEFQTLLCTSPLNLVHSGFWYALSVYIQLLVLHLVFYLFQIFKYTTCFGDIQKYSLVHSVLCKAETHLALALEEGFVLIFIVCILLCVVMIFMVFLSTQQMFTNTTNLYHFFTQVLFCLCYMFQSVWTIIWQYYTYSEYWYFY